MTDDPLAGYEAWATDPTDRRPMNELVHGLAAVLRERDQQLEAARAVTRRLLNFWHVEDEGDQPVWLLECGVADDRVDVEPMSDAERAWLVSVASTPTTEERW